MLNTYSMQILRPLFVALVCLCTILLDCAEAQQNRSALTSYNNTYITTNNSEAITGAILNGFNNDVINSSGNLLDSNTWTQANTFSLNPTFSACTGYMIGSTSAPATCSLTIPGSALAANSVYTNLGFTPTFTVNVTDYCTPSQISTDITACANGAIAAAQALVTGSWGGAIVYFPARNSPYTLLGTLRVTGSFVTLKGDGQQGTYISCANAVLDCVQIGQLSGSTIRDDRILDLGIWGNGSKSAGAGVHIQNTYNFLMQNVDLENMIRGVDNDATASSTNTITLQNVTIVVNQSASDYGIYWHAATNGSFRSDQFTLDNVSVTGQWLAPNVTGLGWDGLAQTLNAKHLSILQVKYGFRVTNNAVSTSYYPGFLNADNLQIEGATLRALSIEAGSDFKISNSDLNNSYGASSQGSGDDYAVALLADVSGSVTRGVMIQNSRVGLNAKTGIYVASRDSYFSNIECVGVGQLTNNTYPCIDMVATANDLQVTNVRGEEFGGPGKASYVVQVESGATGFNGENIDGRYVVTSAVNDLGGVEVCYGHLIQPNGFSGSNISGCSSNQSGALLTQVYANATGGSVQAGTKFVTGTANSYCQDALLDNVGTPYRQLSCGSAVQSYKIALPPQSTSYVYATPLTGATVTAANQQDNIILEPAGTIATLTVVLPVCSSVFDGKITVVSSTQTITTLTVTATGGTVLNAPTTLNAGTGAKWQCVGTTSKWYRE